MYLGGAEYGAHSRSLLAVCKVKVDQRGCEGPPGQLVEGGVPEQARQAVEWVGKGAGGSCGARALSAGI